MTFEWRSKLGFCQLIKVTIEKQMKMTKKGIVGFGVLKFQKVWRGEKIIFGWHAEVFSQSWWGGLEEEELRSKVQLGNTGKAVSFWPHLRENHYTDDGGDHHHIFGAHMENISSFDPRNSPTFSTIITVRERAKKDLNFPAFFHTNKWCLCTII